ncbi:unnamed protein product [Blepharisma stoltei]|uniref:Arginyl-tRNA--protein transferase 1 n=1 Tax=Blepharisma stoltei TaxID=1481888 RepID=A0AAU9J6E6_9CILI|nr:unnamed protein product [Blepharisma stoltei]
MNLISLGGEHTEEACIYCKKGPSTVFGFYCKEMSVENYEKLMFKGYRRWGDICYVPVLEKSCCKLISLRCNTILYKPNKSQKKVQKKFARYLNAVKKPTKIKQRMHEILTIPNDLKEKLKNAVEATIEVLGISFEDKLCVIKRNSPNRKKRFGDYSISSAITVHIKAKQNGLNLNLSDVTELLQNYFELEINNSKWRIFSVENGFINLLENEIEEIKLLDENKNENKISAIPHTYKHELVDSDFSQESYELYKEYVKAVHGETPTNLSIEHYTQTACKTSLIKEEPSHEYPYGLGSFHMLHKIDGILVGVSVIDILPSGVSAVYFFYSSKISFLSPGIFSIMKEIEFVQNNLSERFKYYYLGFYINNIQKMKYKGEFYPSELLCPKKFVWVPIENCLEDQSHNFLELSSCCPLTSCLPKDQDMEFSNANILSFINENAKISINSTIYTISSLDQNFRQSALEKLTLAFYYIGKHLFKKFTFSFIN